MITKKYVLNILKALQKGDHNAEEGLKGKSLRQLNLRGLKFSNMNFSDCWIDGCDLSSAEFHNCNLDNVYFIRSELCDVAFFGCSMMNITFEKCSLVRTFLNVNSAELRSMSIRNSNLADLYPPKEFNILTAGNVGQSGRYTYYCPEWDIVWCGCHKSTMAVFEKTIQLLCEPTDGNGPRKRQIMYLNMIQYFKAQGKALGVEYKND